MIIFSGIGDKEAISRVNGIAEEDATVLSNNDDDAEDSAELSVFEELTGSNTILPGMIKDASIMSLSGVSCFSVTDD